MEKVVHLKQNITLYLVKFFLCTKKYIHHSPFIIKRPFSLLILKLSKDTPRMPDQSAAFNVIDPDFLSPHLKLLCFIMLLCHYLQLSHGKNGHLSGKIALDSGVREGSVIGPSVIQPASTPCHASMQMTSLDVQLLAMMQNL